MGVGVGAAARIFSRLRLKPDIYRTMDGKIIVKDELLNFLAVKMKTMNQDEIVLLATNTFDSEWIESSKKVLFDLCTTTQRNVAHKGSQKDINNIKSCLKVLNECAENIPRFVSHYLEELPPVTFSNMDVSCLLGKVEQLASEVCALKRVMQLQVNVSEDLREVTKDINRRVGALEASDLAPGGGLEVSMALGGGAAGPDDLALRRVSTDGLVLRDGMGALSVDPAHGLEGATPTEIPASSTALPGSPKWSQIVKKGGQHGPAHAHAKPGVRTAISGPKKKSGTSVVGTGAAGNIRTVKTKLVSVFASKFAPDLDAEALSGYLGEKLGRVVSCNRIGNGNGRYSSFKVSAECHEVREMYNPELWPDGAFVRRYYEPRQVGATGVKAVLTNAVLPAELRSGSTGAASIY